MQRDDISSNTYDKVKSTLVNLANQLEEQKTLAASNPSTQKKNHRLAKCHQ